MSSPVVFAQTVVWKGDVETMSLGDKVLFCEDTTGKASIEEISSAQWEPRFRTSIQPVLNFDLSTSDYWIRFAVDNPTHHKLMLELAQPLVRYADLYYRDSIGGKWVCVKSGFGVGLENKPVRHHFQLFPLHESKMQYYLHIKANGTPLPLHLWEAGTYSVKADNQKLIFGIYFGILLFIIANNIFMYFSLHRTVYLHYCFLVFMYATFALCYDGCIVYFFPEADVSFWAVLNPVINQPNGLLYTLFFLNIRQCSPRAYRASLALLVYFLLLVVAMPFLSEEIVRVINQFNGMICLTVMTLLGVLAARRGNRIGTYFAAAYFIFMIIASIEVVYLRTGYPHYPAELSHVLIAILVEVTILAYALPKDLEWEKQEIEKAKNHAQEQVLLQTMENKRIIIEQNVFLEKKVMERTLQLNESNIDLQQLNERLADTVKVIEKQKQAIEKQTKDLTDSINAAQRIQDAMLPFSEQIAEGFGEENYFILYKPRNVVSGDFYFYEQLKDGTIVVAVADCTGHGVPGALMSMVGMNLLEDILIYQHLSQPHQILEQLDKNLRFALKQDHNRNRDGMDLVLLLINKERTKAQYAGAMNSLYYVQNEELHEIKGVKRPIGGRVIREDVHFESHEIDITYSTTFYLCTDGFQDQFGGPNRKKFMTSNLKKLLFSIHHTAMLHQQGVLETTLEDWKRGANEVQIDDITIMGVKVDPKPVEAAPGFDVSKVEGANAEVLEGAGLRIEGVERNIQNLRRI